MSDEGEKKKEYRRSYNYGRKNLLYHLINRAEELENASHNK